MFRSRKLGFIGFVLVLVIFSTLIGSVLAVTNGEPDGNGHPQVGLMVAFIDGAPQWRCSGTMISEYVYLTAGHCTFGADHVEIWFDADVENGIPDNGYPFNGTHQGTPYAHPLYPTASFVFNDVGVVILDSVGPGPYASLPAENSLDALKTQRGKQDVTFTAVGYGLQRSFPDAASHHTVAERIRMVAYPKLNQINVPGFTGDFSMLLSNNANTGGTCFGDSGGPNFLNDTLIVAAVTSFGINGNCAGTGGVFRMDRANARDWVLDCLDDLSCPSS